MPELTDISLLFEDIIDTPAKRRREVERASMLAAQQMKSTRPFSLLAQGIASGIPGQTEAIRQTAKSFGMDAFKTPGERLADQLRGVNTQTRAGQQEAIEMVRQVDPGKAYALQDAYARQERDSATRDAQLANRYQINSKIYSTGGMFNQTATGEVSFVVPATDSSQARTLTDPAAVAREIHLAEAAEAQTDLEQQAALAKARSAADAMQARTTSAIDQANSIKDRVILYDEALRQIEEEGATPGFLDRWTPSIFRSSADKVFTQIASQLGLQVIAGTTFGALSERELALAMETGMPSFNTVEEYTDYLIRKRDAEQKLMREFVFYANYIRTEGYEMSAIEAQDVFNRTRASVRTEDNGDVQLVGTDGNPLVLIQTADEFEALPSGTEYTADGISISVKP
jgi:hypothetical protein